MKDDDIMREIEQLKAQMDALTAAKGRASSQDAVEGPDDQSPSAGPGGETGSWMRELLKHAEELMGGLDLQFKDVPARTALVIFALGVLTGRLLSRRG
jgi:hypothetical protein